MMDTCSECGRSGDDRDEDCTTCCDELPIAEVKAAWMAGASWARSESLEWPCEAQTEEEAFQEWIDENPY